MLGMLQNTKKRLSVHAKAHILMNRANMTALRDINELFGLAVCITGVDSRRRDIICHQNPGERKSPSKLCKSSFG